MKNKTNLFLLLMVSGTSLISKIIKEQGFFRNLTKNVPLGSGKKFIPDPDPKSRG
jgi:hypothetical protein